MANHSVTVHSIPNAKEGLISSEVAATLLFVLLPVIACCWCLVGTATNVINLIVFWTMGFQETINLSLFALAISDLGSLVTLLWCTFCYNPLVLSATLPYNTEDIAHLTGGWPHVAFTRVTGWITAFVTVERYLCIAKPLSVKRIITVTRVKVILTVIFVVNLSAVIPVYLTNLFVWKSVDNGTRIILAMAFTDDQPEIEFKANMFNQIASPLTSFALVFIFSLAITFKLRQQSKWRQATQTSSQSDSTKASQSQTSKEMKVGKMMMTIATIFVVCFTPSIISFLLVFLVPEFKYDGLYRNLHEVMFATSLCVEAFNSSVNIVVYFSMSSKYKQAFFTLPLCLKLKQWIDWTWLQAVANKVRPSGNQE